MNQYLKQLHVRKIKKHIIENESIFKNCLLLMNPTSKQFHVQKIKTHEKFGRIKISQDRMKRESEFEKITKFFQFLNEFYIYFFYFRVNRKHKIIQFP